MHRFKFQLNLRAQQFAHVLSQADDDVPIPYGLNMYIGFIHTLCWRISEDLVQKWLELLRGNIFTIYLARNKKGGTIVRANHHLLPNPRRKVSLSSEKNGNGIPAIFVTKINTNIT